MAQKTIRRFQEFAVLLVIGAWALESRADLGQSREEAETRAEQYESRYNAVAPLFKTDDEDRVIQECWTAGGDPWSRDQALAFSKELVKDETGGAEPEGHEVEGTVERIVYPGGAEAILQGVGDAYYGVEVRSAGFSGFRC